MFQNVAKLASRFLPKPKAPPGIYRCPQFPFAITNTYQVPRGPLELEEEDPAVDAVVLAVVLEEEHPEAVPVAVVEGLVVSAAVGEEALVPPGVVVVVVDFHEVLLVGVLVEASADGVRYSAISRQYVCLSRSGVLGIGHGYFSFATAIMRIYKSLPSGEIKSVNYFIARGFYLHITIARLMSSFQKYLNINTSHTKFSPTFFLALWLSQCKPVKQ